jgi:hypothetical protein
MNIENFRKELKDLINYHSMENGSNTPDFILADYLVECLEAYNKAVKSRETWYGREPKLVDDLPKGV